MINYDQIKKQSKAYERSFIIENIIRLAIHNLMVQEIGYNYFTEKIFPEYEYKEINPKKKLNIIADALRIKGEQSKYNSLSVDYPLLWYLDFRILISLVDYYWNEYFYKIFKKPNKIKKDIIFSLKKISYVRNDIAHNRFINNINLSEIKNLEKILRNEIFDKFILNFNEIVLNPIEDSVKQVIELLSVIYNYVNKKLCNCSRGCIVKR